jgi:hypothetical protein
LVERADVVDSSCDGDALLAQRQDRLRGLGSHDHQPQLRPASVNQRPSVPDEEQRGIDVGVVIHAAHEEHVAASAAGSRIRREEIAIDAVAHDLDVGSGHTLQQDLALALAANRVGMAQAQKLVLDLARERGSALRIPRAQRVRVVLPVAGQNFRLDVVPVEDDACLRH